MSSKINPTIQEDDDDREPVNYAAETKGVKKRFIRKAMAL